MPDGEIIGLDVGQVRTGVARASAVAKLAEPLFSLSTGELINRLKQMADEGIRTVIVGLPRNLAGEETPQTKWVRDWLRSAKNEIPEIKFYSQDEALTSLEARAKSSQLRAKSSVDEHALAAAIILQDFLNSPVGRRVVA